MSWAKMSLFIMIFGVTAGAEVTGTWTGDCWMLMFLISRGGDSLKRVTVTIVLVGLPAYTFGLMVSLLITSPRPNMSFKGCVSKSIWLTVISDGITMSKPETRTDASNGLCALVWWANSALSRASRDSLILSLVPFEIPETSGFSRSRAFRQLNSACSARRTRSGVKHSSTTLLSAVKISGDWLPLTLRIWSFGRTKWLRAMLRWRVPRSVKADENFFRRMTCKL